MTAEQLIGEYVSVYGRMPGRLALQTELSLTQRDAVAALKAYTAAHPDARRSTGGVPFGSKLSKSDRPAPAPAAHATEWKETGDTATIEFKSFREIRNIEELLDAAGVDRDVWTAPTCTVNTWTMPGGADSEEPRIRLWQVKATLKRRSEVADLRRIQAETLAAIAAHAPTYGPITRPPTNGGHLLMLSPSDAHLGKLSWEGETGETYNLDIAVQTVRNSIRTLTADALHHGLDEIVLVLGNDLLNMNDTRGQTFAGTQVSNSDPFWKTFDAARELAVSEIEWLSQYAPVRVVSLAGNHGLTAELHLGKLLEAWFRNNPNVTVDASARPRKYHRHGSVLLGFAHGHEERHASLPQIMASERPQDWAQTTCREWVTGHYHRKGTRQFQPLLEDGGVLIRTMAALCPHDAWSHSKGYMGQAAGEAIVYSRSSLKAQYHHTTEAM